MGVKTIYTWIQVNLIHCWASDYLLDSIHTLVSTTTRDATSSEDIPLSNFVHSTSAGTPKKVKKTGYLFSPKKIRCHEAPPPSSPMCSLKPLKHHIPQSRLSDETNRTFFVSLTVLLKYLMKKPVNLVKFNHKIQLIALYDVYPKVEWLSELLGSEKKEDNIVSAAKSIHIH